jgi:AAA15 family ATPase/GTPase
MLKRLYVDNFRCLEDFELNFDSINLFLGDNGAGKSTVFEVLEKLQSLISNPSTAFVSTPLIANLSTVGDIFKNSDFPRWKNSEEQIIELEIFGNNGVYKYELKLGKTETSIESNTTYTTYIVSEKLSFNQDLLLDVDQEKVEIYSDNGTKNYSSRYNFFQSIIPLLKQNHNNTKMIWFRDRMRRLIILKSSPFLIVNTSSQKDSFLKSTLENYVSWYRYTFDSNQDKRLLLIQSLQEVFDGFIDFKLDRIGEETFMLRLLFKDDESDNVVDYFLSELSDGEKMLIVLYSLFYGLESQDYTICIDEPDNFLALPEIQPWLFQLEDLCHEGKLQALLISHHPELIDYLLASPIGYWFKRQANSSVEVKQINNTFLKTIIDNIQQDNKSGLKMSELIARGWLDE